MKKIGIKKHDMKKDGAVLLAVTMTGIFFSLFVNISYASYAGRLASIQARFPYDAVTRKTVTRDVRSLIAAHKNVKETYIIRDLISVQYGDALCTLEEVEGSMLTRDALIEGRFPQDSTELIISLEFKKRFDIATGDTLTLTAGKRMVGRTGAAAEVAGEDGNERMVPAGEYPAKGEEFRPEGERSFTVTGVFKNNSAFTPANPVVKTLALGDAFKDGTKTYRKKSGLRLPVNSCWRLINRLQICFPFYCI